MAATLDEVKEKLSQTLGKSADQVHVAVDPREGLPDFTLRITVNECDHLGTETLVALLDIGRDSGMDVMVSPESDETVMVVLKKEPVTLSF